MSCSEDEFNREFLLSDKNRFFPKLDKDTIDRITHPFVVGSIEKTKCFSILSRPVQLSTQFKELLQNDTDDIKEINNLLKNIPLAIVRRDIMEDGTKNDNKFRIQMGYFNYINSLICGYPYQYSYVNVDFNDGNEDVSIARVYVLNEDIPTLFT